MTAVTAAASTIAAWPDVAAASTAALDACTALRWHEALRRRIPQASAESRLRGALASALLEGVNCSDADARRWWCDLDAAPVTDPGIAVVVGAMRAVAECEAVKGTVGSAPAHALARLHTAAASPRSGSAAPDALAVLGRPRRSADPLPAEFTHLGVAPPGCDVSDGLQQIVELMSSAEAPAIIRAGLVHAELARLRPFVSHNGVVARAVSRAMLWASGADPTGVACVERGCAARGITEYHGALAAYAAGTADGVRTWMVWWAQAVEAGAHEGVRIADAVMQGRTQIVPR